MRIRTFILMITAVAFLSACNGGTSDRVVATPPVDTPPVDTTLTWDDDNWDAKNWQ